MKKATAKKLPVDRTGDYWTTFEAADIRAFALTDHRQMLLDRYNHKIALREPNPRLNEWGEEVLNPNSMVAEVDMLPLSMKQNLGRFVRHSDPGDLPEFDHTDDESFHGDDRMDNPPTPHELRASRLEKKLSRAKAAQQKLLDEARNASGTPLPEDKKQPVQDGSSAKSPPVPPSS